MKKVVTIMEEDNYDNLNDRIDNDIDAMFKDNYELSTADIKPYIFDGNTYYLATLVFTKID
jgi:hypothetical protein